MNLSTAYLVNQENRNNQELSFALCYRLINFFILRKCYNNKKGPENQGLYLIC